MITASNYHKFYCCFKLLPNTSTTCTTCIVDKFISKIRERLEIIIEEFNGHDKHVIVRLFIIEMKMHRCAEPSS